MPVITELLGWRGLQLCMQRWHHTPHSHSIVPGGFDVMSYTTRLTLLTVLHMRVDTAPRKAGSNWYQSAVMPSAEVTALSATTWL